MHDLDRICRYNEAAATRATAQGYAARPSRSEFERVAYERGWQRYSEHIFLFYATVETFAPDRLTRRAYSAATKAEMVHAIRGGRLLTFLENREAVAARLLAERDREDAARIPLWKQGRAWE